MPKTKIVLDGYVYTIAEKILTLKKHDKHLVSLYFPDLSQARSCINTIRQKVVKSNNYKSSDLLVINDDLRYITVNEQQELFLQYDNEDLTGQRILITNT